jgi:PAS domain S-box-containing protein
LLGPHDSNSHKAPSLTFSSVRPRIVLRGALIFALYLLVFILLDFWAHSVQVFPGIVAWYPPDGLSLAFLLTFGTPFLPGFAIASLISSLFVFHFSVPLSTLIGWAILISLAYGGAVWFLRQYVQIDTQLRKPRDLFWIITAIAAIASILATISVSSMIASGIIPKAQSLWASVQWWIGEMIGVLVVTPTLLIFVMPYLKRFVAGEEFLLNISFPRLSRLILTQTLGIFVVLYIAFYSSWSNNFHPYFLIAIPLIWIAIQHGLPGASLGVSLVNFAIVRIAEWHEFNFVELGQLQLLMLVISLASLFIGIIVSEHKRSLTTSNTAIARQRNKITYELIIISIMAAATWILEYTFDFFETVTDWERRNHIRGLDETLVTISVLGLVGAVFSYRRWKEVEAETRAREKAQVELQGLYGELEARVQERTSDLSRANELLQAEIAERRQADAALKNAEAKYRTLVEQLPAATYIMEYGEITNPIYVSPQIETIFGFTAKEWLADPDLWVNQLYPEDRDKVLAEFDLREKLSQPIDLDYRIVTRQGRVLWIHDQSVLILDETGRRYGHGLIFDITERKKVEESLEQSEKRFRALIENSTEAITLLDSNGGIVYDSPAAPGMLGYGPGEWMDKNIFEFLHPEDIATILPLFQSLSRMPGARSNNILRVKHKNDSWRWIEAVVTNLLEEPAVKAIVANYRDITERRQAEEALIESDQRFRDLFENSPVSIWEEDFSQVKAYLDSLKNEVQTDFGTYLMEHPDMVSTCATLVKILDVNQASLELQGAATKAELLENRSNIFSSKTLVAFQQELITIWNRERRLEIDGIQQTLDGRERDVRIIWAVVPGYEDNYSRVLVSLIDITERKLAEERIQRQLKRLNALRTIDTAISSSFDLDVILDILLEQVLSQLGVDASAVLLVNTQMQTIEYAASRGFHSHALRHTHLKLGEGYASQAVLQRKTIHISSLMESGGKLADALQSAHEEFVDYYGAPLIVKGEVKGVLEIYHHSHLKSSAEWLEFLETLAGQTAIAIDNAQLFENLQRSNAELEQRVARRTAELNQTNLELEHANRTKDEFLATMSHELRTPLNSVLGLAESLLEQRRDPLSDYQQKSLQIIESSGRHLLELINDILDLSKIEAGKFDYYPQPVSVDELCRASLTFVKEQATRKFITITYTEETAVSKIYADPRRLKQILVNLLTNAVKFTLNHGQVDLQVRADAEQGRVQFSVSDNGIGIALEDLKQLFIPFAQVDSSLTREYEGTGLGLALVQKLTDLHGGSVDVESEVGKGSRFTINLPWRNDMEVIELPRKPLIGNSKQAEKSNVPSKALPKRGIVLLADDNMANILTIGDYLESHGYEVIIAQDGLKAIEKAQTTHPDIILLDIQMPVMNGLEAMAHLRANARYADIPIIALTALAMPGDRERCLLAGASEYMSKPVSLKTLKQTIEDLLQNSAGDWQHVISK